MADIPPTAKGQTVPPPLDTPDAARLLDRYYAVGLVCMAVLLLAFPFYKAGEPARRAAARDAVRAENITLGHDLFAQHCASCHGDNATGGRGFPTLGAKEFLASVSDQQLRWLISGGVPGTAMTAYSLDLGGPFTAQEIVRLASYLRSLEEGAPSQPGWFTGGALPPRAVRAADGEDRKDREHREDRPGVARGDDRSSDRDGDRDDAQPAGLPVRPPDDGTAVATLFAAQCAACHGPNGEGTPIAPRVHPLSSVLTSRPDSAFTLIARGKPGTAMMAFSTRHGGTLDPTVIRALVEWLGRPDAPAP